jgi:DNA-binding NarL/FixJ family response regulator
VVSEARGDPGGHEPDDPTTSRRAASSQTPRSGVAIIAQHAAFVELFAATLDASPDLAFAGSAADLPDGVQLVRRTKPDIALLDDDVAGTDRTDAIRTLAGAHDSVRILVLASAPLGPDALTAALTAGARGFVRKRDSVHAVLRAIRAAKGGEIMVELATLESIMRSYPSPASYAAAAAALTHRELEVLSLMARGHDPQAIAEELGIRVSTCRGYEKSIMAKLDAHSQLEAVVVATELGLVRPTNT